MRGLGCFFAVELVKDPETREGLVPFNASGDAAKPMVEVVNACKSRGLWPFAHFNRIHMAPPLIVTDDEVARALAILDEALDGRRRLRGLNAVLGGGLLQDVDAAGGAEADDVGQADLGALDLAVAGLAAEVVADLPDVGDAGGGDRVALGLQAAGHVHRGRAVAPRGAAVEEVDGAALLAEQEVVVVDELGGGEAVVELDEVEVLGADAGLLVGLLGGRLR